MRNYRKDGLPWKIPCLQIPNVFIRELKTQAQQLVSTVLKCCAQREGQCAGLVCKCCAQTEEQCAGLVCKCCAQREEQCAGLGTRQLS